MLSYISSCFTCLSSPKQYSKDVILKRKSNNENSANKSPNTQTCVSVSKNEEKDDTNKLILDVPIPKIRLSSKLTLVNRITEELPISPPMRRATQQDLKFVNIKLIKSKESNKIKAVKTLRKDLFNQCFD